MAILFISVGRFDYWQGIIYLVIGLLKFTLNNTLLKIDPQLLEERAKPGKGSKEWDKLLLGLSLPGTIGIYIIAGLDSGRFH